MIAGRLFWQILTGPKSGHEHIVLQKCFRRLRLDTLIGHSADSSMELQILASSDEPADDKVCPEAGASLFSTITFSWLTPILKKGYRFVNL